MKEADQPYYLHYSTGQELRRLVADYFEGKVTIGYNKAIFHPEFRLGHSLPLGWLDRWLGRVPIPNGALARQVVAKTDRR